MSMNPKMGKPSYPNCPKCDSDRINKIGHESTGTARWVRPQGDEATSIHKSVDYVYLCERCGLSWKAGPQA